MNSEHFNPLDIALAHGTREQADLDTERHITARHFESTVEDLMLAHLDKTGHYKTLGGETRNFLILEDTAGDMHVEVIDAKADEEGYTGDTDESWRADKIISIQVGGQEGAALTYTLYHDGSVRRYDTSDETQESPDDFTDPATLSDHVDNTVSNIVLERDMGVNGIQVEAAEVARLDDVIKTMRLEPSYTYGNLIPQRVVDRYSAEAA